PPTSFSPRPSAMRCPSNSSAPSSASRSPSSTTATSPTSRASNSRSGSTATFARPDSVIELPHAREFLEFCRRSGLRTFLLSTVHPDHFATQARTTGFSEFLDRTYLGVVDKAAKIHSILEENQLHPDETVFIGDMQHDIDTARHGGIHSCAVLT